MSNTSETVLFFVLMLLVVVLMTAAEATIFYFLWNWIIPYLFGLPKISIWMSLGIVVLVDIVGAAFKASVKISKGVSR